MIIFFKNKINIFALIIIFNSFLLGSKYSQYQTDPWHWGTIASEAIDYINGLKLFKEVILMYGPGQPIFFKFMNIFYKLDYHSIGVLTCIIYCLNLFFTYLILLKLTRPIFSLIVVIIIFSLNNYPQTPWPDYYASFCITISCYFLVIYENKKNLIYIILTSLFLVLSIIFRNTYILNITLALLSEFLILYFFLRKKIFFQYFKKKIIFFLSFLFLFFILLILSKNIDLWYLQGIGRTQKYFSDEYFFYPAIKLIYHIFIPKTLSNLFFLIFYLTNFLILLNLIFNKEILNVKYIKKSNLIFFCLLGLFGIIQSYNQYEIWRNISACISIFVVTGYFLYFFLRNLKSKFQYFYITSVSFFLITMVLCNYFNNPLTYPTHGYFSKDGFHKYNNENYYKSNIVYFGNHKFNVENIIYYSEVRSIICKYDKIINFSYDRNFIYICDKKNSISSTFSDIYPPIFYHKNLQTRFENENIKENEIIIADKNFQNKNLTLLKIIKIPEYTRYTKSDIYRAYFDNEIYIYVRKNTSK
jgi:hypothetical protein